MGTALRSLLIIFLLCLTTPFAASATDWTEHSQRYDATQGLPLSALESNFLTPCRPSPTVLCFDIDPLSHHSLLDAADDLRTGDVLLTVSYTRADGTSAGEYIVCGHGRLETGGASHVQVHVRTGVGVQPGECDGREYQSSPVIIAPATTGIVSLATWS